MISVRFWCFKGERNETAELAERLFSFLQAAIAGCFAEAQALQRMAGFRSRTARSVTHLLRQIYNDERGVAAALDLGRDAPDPPFPPPAVTPSPHPEGCEEKEFRGGKESVLGTEVGLGRR